MTTESRTVRVAVVTGSSRGLGRAFAKDLAKNGYSVVINGTTKDGTDRAVDEITQEGGIAVGCVGSVSDYDFCGELVQTAVDAFGGVSLLVNNAGITRDRSLMKMSIEDFDEIVAVHLRGTFGCSQAAARAMSGSGGSIVNVSSGSGLFGMFGQSNYAAAKAGIIGLSRVMHLELLRRGIRTNVLAPVASTDMTSVFDNQAGVTHAAVFPPADRVAPLVTFLGSDAARDISGQVLSFDGTTMSVWTHPRANTTVEIDRLWHQDDFVGALTDEALATFNPDKWGSGVTAS